MADEGNQVAPTALLLAGMRLVAALISAKFKALRFLYGKVMKTTLKTLLNPVPLVYNVPRSQ